MSFCFDWALAWGIVPINKKRMQKREEDAFMVFTRCSCELFLLDLLLGNPEQYAAVCNKAVSKKKTKINWAFGAWMNTHTLQ